MGFLLLLREALLREVMRYGESLPGEVCCSAAEAGARFLLSTGLGYQAGERPCPEQPEVDPRAADRR